MAQKSTADLKAQTDANITSNGVNSNTGANHNTLLNDILDSIVNKDSDVLSIVTNVYRSKTEAITIADTQITFSTLLSSALYEIIIFDPDGVGFEKPTNKLATGFKIKGLSSGNIIYLAILTN